MANLSAERLATFCQKISHFSSKAKRARAASLRRERLVLGAAAALAGGAGLGQARERLPQLASEADRIALRDEDHAVEGVGHNDDCPLYTSDAADDKASVYICGALEIYKNKHM